jgi:hypothetical protein
MLLIKDFPVFRANFGVSLAGFDLKEIVGRFPEQAPGSVPVVTKCHATIGFVDSLRYADDGSVLAHLQIENCGELLATVLAGCADFSGFVPNPEVKILPKAHLSKLQILEAPKPIGGMKSGKPHPPSPSDDFTMPARSSASS